MSDAPLHPSGVTYVDERDDWEHAPPGRPTHLSDDATRAICEAVMRGAKPARAAILAGLDRSTWWRCRQRAKAGVEPFKTRVRQVELAEAAFLAECEARIQIAARGGEWKADQWLLETRDRATYGKRQETTVRNVERNVTELSREELMRIARGDDDGRG